MIQNKFYHIGNLGYKIALFSDIHYEKNYDPMIFENILENLRFNKPDFICISGDIIDYSSMIYEECMLKLKEFIKNLGFIAPTIVSLGNHDISNKMNGKRIIGNWEEINKWFMDLNKLENVYYIYNKFFIRDKICFTSYNPPFSYYHPNYEDAKLFVEELDKTLSIKPNYYNVLLCHSPISVFKPDVLKSSKELQKIDLILSGHMHNGLILKLFDKKGNMGLISPLKKMFPKYARGMAMKKLERKTIYLVISGGVVKLSSTNSKLLSRFNKLYPISVDYINI